MIADVTRSLGTDYYLLDELFTDEERRIRDRVRAFADAEVIPIINEYWEKAEFPFELVPKVAALNIAGGTIEEYGCPGMSQVAAGLVAIEMARGDGSFNTFFGVHSGLAMGTVAICGSEEQRRRWLPGMARMEKIGAWGLTEPDHGSDSVMLESTARRDGDYWVLNGEKRWIGNATFADLVIIWARDVEDRQVKAFVLEKDENGEHHPGFSTELIKGKMTGPMASLAKMNNARKAKQVCADARDIMGGNGVLLEYHVARHLSDMEIVYTYEGTDTIQSLIVGRDVTGISAFV